MANTLPTGSTAITDPNTPANQMKVNADGSINTTTTVTPAANQRVNAQSGDFVAGSVVDLATLLTLAGAPTDANTINSLMGRLTKIRDLLNGTLSVNTITNYAAETGGNLATIASQTATPNVSDRWARQLGQVDLARVLGATMSASNPVIMQDQIRAAISAGQSFSATTGKQTSAGAVQTGFCLWNPNTSGKSVLIYSVRIGIAASSVHQVNLVTTDPGISGVSVTAQNMKPGGASSVVTLEAQNTAVATSGNILDEIYVTANAQTEFLANNAAILLPAGASNGMLVLVNTSTNVWFVSCKYLEF